VHQQAEIKDINQNLQQHRSFLKK